jgi:hypothetical protein
VVVAQPARRSNAKEATAWTFESIVVRDPAQAMNLVLAWAVAFAQRTPRAQPQGDEAGRAVSAAMLVRPPLPRGVWGPEGPDGFAVGRTAAAKRKPFGR